MVISETDYPHTSKKWYQSLWRKKLDAADHETQKPYIFSYEDPKAYEQYKLMYKPISELQFNEHTKPIDAHQNVTSVFNYSDNTTPTESYATQYETIFTYAEPLSADPLLTKWNEDSNQEEQAAFGRFSSALLLGFSAMLFILFFPILCWFYIKHVAKNERLVVIRLGRRLPTKSPGFVITLPICDRSHRLLMDEQTLDVGPVSGETKDKGEVEVRCELTYRVIDPDCIYASTRQSPRKLLRSITETYLPTALGHLDWPRLQEVGGKQDLANELVTSINCYCGVHGLQIAGVACTAMVLTKAPPSPETVRRSTLSAVHRQLQGLTSLFFPRGKQPTISKPSTDAKTDTSVLTDTSEAVTADTADSSNRLSKLRSQSVDVPPLSNEEAVPRARLMSLGLTDASATRAILCSQVIARAQPFLNNDLVCRALDRNTLQLVIGSESFSEPLPPLTGVASDESHFSVVYLDAKSGRAAVGIVPDPEVVLYVTSTDLSEIIAGRLDVMQTINDGRTKIEGNKKVLEKLRHLLYLRSG